MVLRNLKSDFVGGAYVFPGGAVDEADEAPDLLERCGGIDDATASRILGLASSGVAYFVACARELFEEAGLLLAVGDDGSTLDASDPALVTRLGEHRRALNDGEATLVDVLADERLVLDLSTLRYFAHWITPVGPPRRYDTRFFVAAAPPGQVPLHDDRELVAHTWVTPAEALARHEAGEMQLILPTTTCRRSNRGSCARATGCGSCCRAIPGSTSPVVRPMTSPTVPSATPRSRAPRTRHASRELAGRPAGPCRGTFVRPRGPGVDRSGDREDHRSEPVDHDRTGDQHLPGR
jgi:8-oxo-dGTP pyrophosphatase MutT (NUDIX family)